MQVNGICENNRMSFRGDGNSQANAGKVDVSGGVK